MRIRAAAASDAAAIAAIYAPFVTDSAVTFENRPPTADEMRLRIAEVEGVYPWLVAEDEDASLLGYAYACAFRSRPAYRFAVETTVYVRAGAHGRGVGAALYGPLIATLEAQGYTQAIAAITLPNPASVALHERCGFARAGTYAQVGWKLDEWRDVGLWQRPLARPAAPPREPLKLSELA